MLLPQEKLFVPSTQNILPWGICLYSQFWAATTKYYRLGGLHNKPLFPIVLEPRKSKIRCLQIQYLGRALFLACREPPSHCVFTWWRERGRQYLFLIRAVIPSWGPTHMASSKSNNLPKALSPLISHWELQHQDLNLGVEGDINIHSIA